VHAGTRHRTGVAESRASTVIAAGARPFGDLWLHLRPRWRPVSPSGIEDDRGRAAPHAVKIQPKSVYGNECAGLRIKDVRGGAAAARYLLAGDRDCGDERYQ
jgi:hypothetical protein